MEPVLAEPTAIEPAPDAVLASFVPIDAAYDTCIEADPSQTGLNLCGRDRRDAYAGLVTELEGRLSAAHPGTDLTTAWRAHRDAEHAWLTQLYTRDGSMWPMVHAGHEARFLQDRAVELSYALCDPPPAFTASDDCYGKALCEEAVYDADLNAAYQTLTSGSGGATTDLLRASQRAWIAHRDVETPPCTGAPVARALRVRQRVEQLRRYVEAAEIGG